MREATSSSAGIASSSIPASAFRAARFTIPSRVSNVALPMWGTITHLRYKTKDKLKNKKRKAKFGERNRIYVPGLLHERMVSADMGLTLDDVKAGTPDPFFAQCLRERVRVNERSACRVHQHGMFLHLAQKICIDYVSRVLPARREHEEHVALARELVQFYAPDGAQVVLRGERLLKRGVTRRAGVGRVYAVRETEG